MKLAAKFTSLLLVGIVLLLIVDGYLDLHRDIGAMDQDMQRDARQLSETLGPLVAEQWKQGGHKQVEQFLQAFNERESVASGETKSMTVRWVLLEEPDAPQRRPIADNSQLRRVIAGETTSIKRRDEGGESMVTYTKVSTGEASPGALEVTEQDRHSGDRMKRFTSRTVLLASLTAMLGVGMVVLLGREMVGRPLEVLIEKTRRVGTGDLSGPIEMSRRDEFGELATAINSMCDQLSEANEKVETETTARIQAIEELRHADRLRTVGRLASGIAHEIGTPLNVVGGRADMIATGELSSEQTKENAKIIKAESDRIASTIRQLLDFARRDRPNRTNIDLRQIALQTAELLRPLGEKQGVMIEVDLGDALFCDVDFGQIQQLLTNLVINAIHASDNGSKVSMEVARAEFDQQTQHPGAFASIAVIDHGAGIAESDLAQVFEPFFTTKEVGSGTGLGLSIAFGIAQEHGGWIDVDSQVGRGSVFTAYLPIEGGAG